jgi:hypothetical protein
VAPLSLLLDKFSRCRSRVPSPRVRGEGQGQGLLRSIAGAWFLLLWLSVPAAAQPVQPWVELAADGALSVRTVVAPGMPCPAVTADGAAVAAKPRGAPDAAYPVQAVA